MKKEIENRTRKIAVEFSLPGDYENPFDYEKYPKKPLERRLESLIMDNFKELGLPKTCEIRIRMWFEHPEE